MKKYIIFSFLWIFSNLIQMEAVVPPRKTINFNREWKYALGDYMGGEQVSFDDYRWESVGLPHSFSIPYFMSKDFYVGYGWYRKHFFLHKEDLSKRIFLEFDGVFQEAEIYINGHLSGTHLGGYTGFPVDISSEAKSGDNLVAVRVNNIWKPDIAPRAGEHVFSGGIYRNVRLVIKSPVYIDWYGTFITTPDLGKNHGRSSVVNVVTDICNRTKKADDYRLVAEVFDKMGKKVASAERVEKVAANTVQTFNQVTTTVRSPQLWSPGHPVLYRLVNSLYKGKTLIDCETNVFGFRWMEWTVNNGFFLNGRHLYFRGVNVHQDQAGWGDAVTESAMRRDVQQMKDAGFNFIRGSHYPHAPAFVEACDEIGLCFWSETPFWGIGGFKADGYWDSSAYPTDKKYKEKFEANVLQQLREMIRIYRNHPSIVAWSMCNEAFFSAQEIMPEVRQLLKKMVNLSHQLDSTRPAAIGGAQRPLGKDRIDVFGDIAGYNGDGGTLPDFQHPAIPNIVSEYGSTTAERPGEYTAGWGNLQKNDSWRGLSWRSGQAIWCGFDHGSIAGNQLGKMGIVDYFRLPKRSWYWYRNEYRKIAPPKWPENGLPVQLKLEVTKVKNIRIDGTEDVKIIVTVLDAAGNEINNSPSVKLKLISGPGEFPTGTSITFDKNSDIRIAEGKAAITFRSYYSGTSVIEATSPGLKSARIIISFTGNSRYINGKTPAVREHPYIRFMSNKSEQIVQTFGENNPTFASSQQENKTAGLAADGLDNTYWQASDSDVAPFWILDTEKGLLLRQIYIKFPQKGIYRYTVETSEDEKQWINVLDEQKNMKKESERIIDLSDFTFHVYGRFIRISFQSTENLPSALSEVKVTGLVRN
jgi:beta-galactosidase